MDLRNQPHSQEAEQAVLASLLVYPKTWETISDIIDEADFFLPAHAEVFRVIEGIAEKGGLATPPAVIAHLGSAQYVENPTELLAGILPLATSPTTAEAYARLLADISKKREMIEVANDLMEKAHGPLDADEIQEEAERRLFQMTPPKSRGVRFIHDIAGDVIKAVEEAKRSGGVSGIPTGFTDLDGLLSGLHNSNLIILAARPAMGKTALALNIASHASKTTPTLFFSLEMGAEELAARELSSRTGIQTHEMKRGRADIQSLICEKNEMGKGRLIIDDRPALSVTQIRNTARRAKRQQGIGLIVVDYLQLMREKAENKVVEISEISRGLKAIAKELNIPVLALSQLSRAVEQRDDKRPVLSDLRESGSIEQDADVVMFIYREEYYLREPEQGSKSDKDFAQAVMAYNERKERSRGIAQVIVAKHRNGKCDTVELHFDPERVRFSNLSRYGVAA